MQSSVASITVDPTTYPPAQQAIGIPFATQPIVTITDQNGDPVSNVYVVAFTWPEPIFAGTPTVNNVDGNFFQI